MCLPKETKAIKIEIPDGYEIDKENSSFEEIKFKEIEREEVSSWEELEYIEGYYVDEDSDILRYHGNAPLFPNKKVFPTKQYAEASLALAQLLQLRQRVVGNWKPNETYYAIRQEGDSITVCCIGCGFYRVMSFKNKKQATNFLSTHKDLLEIAKPLL